MSDPSRLPPPERMTVDFETRSVLNVMDTGAWRYSEHPSTEVLCLSYKLGAGESNLWVPGMPFPQAILDHIEEGGMFEAHNVQFERAIWKNVLKKRMGIPMPKRWCDTLAVCAYRGIPLKLDHAGKALNLPILKDSRGKYLLQQLSKPRKPLKKEVKEFEEQGLTPEEFPTLWREDFNLMEELYDYCLQDSDSEHCLSETLGPLPPQEYRIWVLDQIINQRGVCLDIDAVRAALAISERLNERLTIELQTITDNEIETAGQVKRIIEWLRKHGLKYIDNLQKDTVDGYLAHKDDLEPHVARVLEIRQLLSRASAKKLSKMLETVCENGRIMGLLQYHGAGTGRWAGRLVQPQNFPRGNADILKRTDIEELIEHIKVGLTDPDAAIDLLELFYGDPMDAIATALRGMFVAGEGRKLNVADFSAIEARVVMWVAGCQKAIDAFAAYDRGEGPDIYCVMAQELYQRPINKKDNPEERQLGKITILGCGYQMGAAKLQFQAEKDYGLVLDLETAKWLVDTYRETYAEVKWLWYGLQDAAINTVKTGKPHSYSCIRYELVHDAAGTWLACVLPNGRKLWYYDPVIEQTDSPWGIRDQLTYMGRDNKRGGAWGRISTYGGMLTENVVQAISRDLMVEGMIRVEQAGYPIILTVHDEIVAEPPEDHGSLKEFESLMAGPTPPWATGCPVSVEGWEGPRYKKG